MYCRGEERERSFLFQRHAVVAATQRRPIIRPLTALFQFCCQSFQEHIKLRIEDPLVVL